jgi:hypothetical protein
MKGLFKNSGYPYSQIKSEGKNFEEGQNDYVI